MKNALVLKITDGLSLAVFRLHALPNPRDINRMENPKITYLWK